MLLPHSTCLLQFPSVATPSLIFSPSPIPNPYKFKFKFTVHSSSSSTIPQTISQSAIKRISEKLKSLGYIQEQQKTLDQNTTNNGEIFLPFPQQLPKNHVGHTIDSSFTTPINPVPQPGSGTAISRFHELKKVVDNEKKLVKKERKVPSLAELKLPKKELKRLITLGIALKTRLNVGKAGITEGIVNGIHERWRRNEVVRIRCEDLSRINMKRTHDLLETKTGGLVVWRAGGSIILYRGVDYKYPYFVTNVNDKNDAHHDESSPEPLITNEGESENYINLAGTGSVKSGSPEEFNQVPRSSLIHGVGSPNKVRFQLPGEAQLAEEADGLLDGLGPRFTDWWGYDPLPVDADLLPAVVRGYRRPFRLLPYGIKPKLTDDEMTTLRRLSRPLPCHFALGRNRGLQGLAVSMVKLWEKCEIAKVAVKRGTQNTNSDMMAEELKWLTGGTLLSRDREFITFYRGKDFLPAAVSTAIEDRRKHGTHKDKQLKVESSSVESMPQVEMRTAQDANDHELRQTIQKNRELAAVQRKMKFADSRIKRISTKLSMALEKKEKAEILLAELEKAVEPQELEIDKEGITAEERYMLKKVGLRMKAYLPLGRRGVFAGTVENMHLHWKYRELVKIMASGRSIEEVHAAARTLEAESGGVLIAVERVNREYAIIVYRGKNYLRPADLRPTSLLNKKQAMKRSIEAQRHESLQLHVLKLNKNIDHLKLQLVTDDSEASGSQPGENSMSKTSGKGSSGEFSCTENDVSSRHLADDQEFDSGKYLRHDEETIKLLKLMDTTSKYTGPDETKLKSSSPKPEATVKDVDSMYEEGSKDGHKLLAEKKIQLSTEGEVPFKAAPLSNRDRLLLRKQALKMGKRPVIAIGRNNVVTGVAKTIKTHFMKHPLAIVNVKGRAEGTSIQEVVFMLEQATGATLVSQETNKVILYRGWGMDEGQKKDKRSIGYTVTGRERKSSKEVVSPELMEAIRVECGLGKNDYVERTL
ncbi:hypothetical protein ACHQM5_008460 [Ranunculus cassubicifolius]